jgi:TIR domain
MSEAGESEKTYRSEPYVAGAAGAGSKVFISYSSQDATVAERVCSALEAAGLPCWIAPRDVRAGESYAAAIVEAISSSRMLVLLLSQGAISSPHVLREVERAQLEATSGLVGPHGRRHIAARPRILPEREPVAGCLRRSNRADSSCPHRLRTRSRA